MGSLGVVYQDRGKSNRAIEYHERHLALARELGNIHGVSIALGNLGNAYDALSETDRAIQQCIDESPDRGVVYAAVFDVIRRAVTEIERGCTEEALATYSSLVRSLQKQFGIE